MSPRIRQSGPYQGDEIRYHRIIGTIAGLVPEGARGPDQPTPVRGKIGHVQQPHVPPADLTPRLTLALLPPPPATIPPLPNAARP